MVGHRTCCWRLPRHQSQITAVDWARAIRTDTTATTTVPVMDTAIAVGLEWLNYRAGSLARAITMALSTESWDLRLGEQFGPTSATMDTWADLFLPAD